MTNNIQEQLKLTIRDIPNFPKEGILFKDITPLFLNPLLTKQVVEALVNQVKDLKIDAIAGIESRGFLLGILMAQKLEIPFILIRKAGKLPGKVIKKSYSLEYGEAIIEVQEDVLTPNSNILIHDDLLATGGTALAAKELISQKANVVGYSFLVDLTFLNGKEKLIQDNLPIHTFIQF